MHVKLYIKLLLLAVAVFSCKSIPEDIDGNSYTALKFGKMIWMTENLNVSHFRNGDKIPEARTTEEWVKFAETGTPACCFLQNDSGNRNKLGRLYNWFAVADPRGLAPKGWHIPSDEEWFELTEYLGGGVVAALQMRVIGTIDTEAGFSGLAGGARGATGTFYGISSHGYWWTASQTSNSTAWMQLLDYKSCDTKRLVYAKTAGLSVRCVRD
jgi:uncharacterized protein (TIGR02145 family)